MTEEKYKGGFIFTEGEHVYDIDKSSLYESHMIKCELFPSMIYKEKFQKILEERRNISMMNKYNIGDLISKNADIAIAYNDSNVTDYERYRMLIELETISKSLRQNITNDIGNPSSYYIDASNKMVMDIIDYLNNYVSDNRRDLSSIIIFLYSVTGKGKNKRLTYKITDNHKLNMKGLGQKINNFPKYYIFDIIEIEKSNMLSREDYHKFIEIREENSLYFLPYIQYILDGINNIEIIR